MTACVGTILPRAAHGPSVLTNYFFDTLLFTHIKPKIRCKIISHLQAYGSYATIFTKEKSNVTKPITVIIIEQTKDVVLLKLNQYSLRVQTAETQVLGSRSCLSPCGWGNGLFFHHLSSFKLPAGCIHAALSTWLPLAVFWAQPIMCCFSLDQKKFCTLIPIWF